jgi:hypothetical protein
MNLENKILHLFLGEDKSLVTDFKFFCHENNYEFGSEELVSVYFGTDNKIHAPSLENLFVSRQISFAISPDKFNSFKKLFIKYKNMKEFL